MMEATRRSSPELDEFLSAHPGRDLDRDGLRYHYLDEGDGRPVVMVHGNPTWSFYYRRLVEALSPSHRVIVPDHIGCGLSDKPDDARYQYTLESRVDDLERLLNQLGIKRDVTLVVHDWGGMIGLTYAARHPERIARLVVLNTAAFHMPAEKRFPWSLGLCRGPALGSLAVRGLNGFARGTARIGCTKERMPRSLRDAYAAPYDSWANRIAVHRFVQDIPLRPQDRCYDLVSWVESRLQLLRPVPMLIGWGMKDFVFDESFLKEWERRFPRALVRRYPEAGHYVLEDEAETLIPEIKDFLDASGSPPSSNATATQAAESRPRT
jgi:haloalkane dehalogenase